MTDRAERVSYQVRETIYNQGTSTGRLYGKFSDRRPRWIIVGLRPDRVDLPVYDESSETLIVPEQLQWHICVDKYSDAKGLGAGIVVYTPEGGQIEQAVKFMFGATNNEAKYEAVLAGLRMAKILGLTEFEIISDSKLVIGQITGEIEAHGSSMRVYLEAVQKVVQEEGAQSIRFTHRC